MEIATARDAADLFTPKLAARRTELCCVAYLGPARALIGTRHVEGGASAVAFPVAMLVAEGVRLGAAALVVAHNHPSGDAEPSAADVLLTRRLAEACAMVGLRLYDHLIHAGDGWVSLRGRGLL